MISSLYKKHSITFFYLMLLLVFSHSFISAQTPDMPFNIYLKQASLKEFTAKIEQLSEYSFIYGEEVVLKHPITLDLKETPLTTILQTAFIKQDISFEITKHHIILKKTTSLPIKQHFTLNGYVLDEISKETLIGANIYDQQNKQGTITNPFGFFSIYNPQIQISAESGTKRSIFRQKNKTKRSKKRLHTTLIKPEQKVNEDLCSGFIVS